MMSHAGTVRSTDALLRTAAKKNAFPAGKVMIDNLDGSGVRDYSKAVVGDPGIRIERSLNAASLCMIEVLIEAGGLPLPLRRARVVLNDDEGRPLFTGYLATEPVREDGSSSAMYRVRLNAISDEWLLDSSALHSPTATVFRWGWMRAKCLCVCCVVWAAMLRRSLLSRVV